MEYEVLEYKILGYTGVFYVVYGMIWYGKKYGKKEKKARKKA